VVQRWCKGDAGAEVQRWFRDAKAVQVQRERGGTEVVQVQTRCKVQRRCRGGAVEVCRRGAGAEMQRRCSWQRCRVAEEVQRCRGGAEAQMWCRGGAGAKEGKGGGAKVVVVVQRWFSGGALKRCRCRGGGAEVVQRWVVQVQRYRDGGGEECRGGAEVVNWWCC